MVCPLDLAEANARRLLRPVFSERRTPCKGSIRQAHVIFRRAFAALKEREMSTPLYRDYILANNPDPADLQRKVWDGTPWIVDVYTGGSANVDRDRSIILWCADHFGEEAWPFSDEPRAGRWKRGGATVFGWTWYGFDTEEAMNEFRAAWPDPTIEEIAAEQGPRFDPQRDGSKQDRGA